MINYSCLESRIIKRETELQLAYDALIERREEVREIIKDSVIEMRDINKRIEKCRERAREQGVSHIL